MCERDIRDRNRRGAVDLRRSVRAGATRHVPADPSACQGNRPRALCIHSDCRVAAGDVVAVGLGELGVPLAACRGQDDGVALRRSHDQTIDQHLVVGHVEVVSSGIADRAAAHRVRARRIPRNGRAVGSGELGDRCHPNAAHHLDVSAVDGRRFKTEASQTAHRRAGVRIGCRRRRARVAAETRASDHRPAGRGLVPDGEAGRSRH